VAEARSCTGFLEPLRELPGVRAGWLGRLLDLDLALERDQAMQRLRPHHQRWVHDQAGPGVRWWRPEQVHGDGVAVVPANHTIKAADGLPVVPAVDGLITAARGQLLSVVVADCGPLWLAARSGEAVGLVHSGRRGTELGILEQAVKKMTGHFGIRPSELVAVLGPCIRPPHYEVDFAAEIGHQAARLGVGAYHDCGRNTATEPDTCYSYRVERGRTGRMLAAVWLENNR
jgi:copper oxidase (laccase) domain-containing protein